MRKIPVLKIGLVVFIVLAVVVMFCLAARISTMSNDLRQIKVQLAEIRGSIGTGNEASNVEREKLKAEMAELKREVDAIKARQKHQPEAAGAGNEAGAKKSEANAKKTKAKEKPWWHFGL